MKTFIFLSVFPISFFSFGQEESSLLATNNQLEVIVYPNPVVEKFTIKAVQGASCSLINSSGIVLNSWIIDQTNCLQISNLNSGIYQLIIEKEGVRFFKKIVVL